MKRLLVSLLLVLVAVVLVFTASCGPGEEAAKTYKLAFLGPLTGPGAAWGIPVRNGMEMAAEEINQAGGIVVGGETYMIQIVAEDDKAAPEESVTAVQKLIYDEKVQYMWGPLTSTSALAVQPITEENRVVMTAPSSLIVGPEYPYSFSYISLTWIRAGIGYQWVKQNRPQVQRVALIAERNPTGEEVMEHTWEIAEALGMEVVASEYYEVGTTDFTPILTKIVAKNPDLLDTGTASAGPVALMVKQGRELGYEGLFYTTYQPPAEVLAAAAGLENAEGLIAAGGPNYQKGTPEEQAFYHKYVERFGEEAWGEAADLGRSWVEWITSVFEEVDSFDPDVVVEAWSQSEFENPVTGARSRFGGEETYGIRRVYEHDRQWINIFQDGEWELDAVVMREEW